MIQRKPAKKIDVLKGFIIMAHKDSIFYLNANKLLYPDENSEDSSEDSLSNNSQNNNKESKQVKNFVNVDVAREDVKALKLHKDYRIIQIFDIGNESDAIVLENLVTRQVRYVRVYYEEDIHDRGDVKSRLKLV